MLHRSRVSHSNRCNHTVWGGTPKYLFFIFLYCVRLFVGKCVCVNRKKDMCGLSLCQPITIQTCRNRWRSRSTDLTAASLVPVPLFFPQNCRYISLYLCIQACRYTAADFLSYNPGCFSTSFPWTL